LRKKGTVFVVNLSTCCAICDSLAELKLPRWYLWLCIAGNVTALCWRCLLHLAWGSIHTMCWLAPVHSTHAWTRVVNGRQHSVQNDRRVDEL